MHTSNYCSNGVGSGGFVLNLFSVPAVDLQSKEFLDLKDDKYSRAAFEVRTKSLAGTVCI
jgi:hypothetical protein